MSTLKVNKLRDTAGSADAITLDPNGGAVLAGVTTVTSVKVGAAVTISESGIEASGIGITCANINGTQIGGRRNLIINGAMNVAQRGTSSTSVGYQTVDRIYGGFANTDEAPTFTQADISSSDDPYKEGFRKSYKIQNGNQTSGAGSADEVFMRYKVEAQDLAQSGWDYTSTSSFITLSFWVKSSVSQQFQTNIRIYPESGDQKEFCFGYTPAANTWTKVVKTIPGASGNVLRGDNDTGMFLQFTQFYGTDYTANTRNFDTWETKNNNQNFKDFTTTWYETNDATWEITGFQLEVGPQATPFEHRSFVEELTLCQRYYFQGDGQELGASLNNYYGCMYGSGNSMIKVSFPTTMRAKPTVTTPSSHSGGGTFSTVYENFTEIVYYITGDDSVSIAPSEVKASAEL